MNLPPLTKDFPGIGGSLKGRAEDFFVQEIPLYEPSGAGEHVYCEIQKVGHQPDMHRRALEPPHQLDRLRVSIKR